MPCPALPLLTDNTLASLVTQDAEASISYAKCQAKHRAAVEAYERVRAAIAAQNTPKP